MINANKAKELVQAHNDAVVEQRKAQVAEFLEKVVSPVVEKTAMQVALMKSSKFLWEFPTRNAVQN